MNRLERFNDLNEVIVAALAGWQAGMWTAIPGIVESFDAAKMTCVVQPAIQGRKTNADGTEEWVTPPLLLDCPVVFPSGGGYTMTFPIAQGDEALVVLASRAIDNWWLLGGVRTPAEMRMHSLSDGFAIVGVRSQPRVLAAVSTDTVQLRNDAGDTYVEIDGTTVNIVATVVNVTAPNVNVVADTQVLMTTPQLRVTGNITALYGQPDAISLDALRDVYNTHTHNGVTPGVGNSGGPNQVV